MLPKFEVTVVQVEPLVEVRMMPFSPPATHKLFPKATEFIMPPEGEICVVDQVEPLVEVAVGSGPN